MKKYNEKHEAMKKEAIEAIMNNLEWDYEEYYCDLHNYVFNRDWYRIIPEQCKAVLNEYDVFEALELVQEYEMQQFGHVNTDLSDPKELVSMVWYIIGDEVIGEMVSEIEEFSDNWNSCGDEATNTAILEKMKKLYN